jgi:hypothetical protein
MNDATRRGFLTAAGLSTAAIATLGVAGEVPAAADEPTLPADAEGPMVAYVRDVRKGELALMIEGHEVIVRDKKLVTRLAAAFERAGR